MTDLNPNICSRKVSANSGRKIDAIQRKQLIRANRYDEVLCRGSAFDKH